MLYKWDDKHVMPSTIQSINNIEPFHIFNKLNIDFIGIDILKVNNKHIKYITCKSLDKCIIRFKNKHIKIKPLKYILYKYFNITYEQYTEIYERVVFQYVL